MSGDYAFGNSRIRGNVRKQIVIDTQKNKGKQVYRSFHLDGKGKLLSYRFPGNFSKKHFGHLSRLSY
jgi:hypothetical protein